VNEG
jgi:hypothetical protein